MLLLFFLLLLDDSLNDLIFKRAILVQLSWSRVDQKRNGIIYKQADFEALLCYATQERSVLMTLLNCTVTVHSFEHKIIKRLYQQK